MIANDIKIIFKGHFSLSPALLVIFIPERKLFILKAAIITAISLLRLGNKSPP